MSTDTDGAPPSVAPGPDDGRGSSRPADDSGPLWLQQEIRRRVAARAGRSGGRHARHDGIAPADTGHLPRHATATPGPGAPAPPAARRVAPQLGTATRPRPPGGGSSGGRDTGPGVPVQPVPLPRRRPAPPSRAAAARLLSAPEEPQPHTPGEPGPDTGEVLWRAEPPPQQAPAAPSCPPAPEAPAAAQPGSDAEPEGAAKRVRVVFSERRGIARPVRTVVDIQESGGVGELLRANLIGSQLRVALRFAAFGGLTLGLLPLLFALLPAIGGIEVLGLRLPWLLLGLLVYPFLFGVGWWFTRTAERVEHNFADHVQD